MGNKNTKEKEKENKHKNKNNSSHSSEDKEIKNNNKTPLKRNKKRMKDHPLLHKKDYHPKQIKNSHYTLDKNPIINILDQHREHKFRIAKTIAVISVFFISIFISIIIYNNWTKKKLFNKKISNIEKRIKSLDSKINQTPGYERDKTLKKAIEWTYYAQKKDFKKPTRWIKKRKGYMFQLQNQFNKPKKNKNFVVKAIAAEMISIPQGYFYMGRLKNEVRNCEDELPRHLVKINYTFWMGKTEITNSQYKVFFPHFSVKDHRGYSFNGTTQPVVNVSWHLANDYCKMLTFREKKARRLPFNYEYRLPTEAEWEYACRAGTKTVYYWGNKFGEEGAKYANILDIRSSDFEKCHNSKDAAKNDKHYITASVESYKPNAYGLYDMNGNAWEWCWDWYNPKAYTTLFNVNPVQIDPIVSKIKIKGNFERIRVIDSTSKVIRGGCCFTPPLDARSATRDSCTPATRNSGIGFRIVLAPKITLISSEASENPDDEFSLDE